LDIVFIHHQIRFSEAEWRLLSPASKGIAPLQADDWEVIRFCQQWRQGQAAFTLQTSGSTSKPKPIQVQRSQMQASAQATLQALAKHTAPISSALLCLNPAFIAGKMMMVRALVGQFDLFVLPPSSAVLAKLPADVTIGLAAMVPLQIQTCLPDALLLEKLNGFQAVLVGGASVGYALKYAIQQEVLAPVWATFGMTETVSHIALQRLNGASPQDTFEVLPQIEIKQNEAGCLCIKGAVTLDQWIETNDQVELIGATQFKWLGRLDWVVNSGGIKIQIESVEAVLAQWFFEQGFTFRFFCGGIPDEQLGERLCLVVENFEPTQVWCSALWKALEVKLPRFYIPKGIVVLTHFTETPTAKLNRKAMLQQIAIQQLPLLPLKKLD